MGIIGCWVLRGVMWMSIVGCCVCGCYGVLCVLVLRDVFSLVVKVCYLCVCQLKCVRSVGVS